MIPILNTLPYVHSATPLPPSNSASSKNPLDYSKIVQSFNSSSSSPSSPSSSSSNSSASTSTSGVSNDNNNDFLHQFQVSLQSTIERIVNDTFHKIQEVITSSIQKAIQKAFDTTPPRARARHTRNDDDVDCDDDDDDDDDDYIPSPTSSSAASPSFGSQDLSHLSEEQLQTRNRILLRDREKMQQLKVNKQTEAKQKHEKQATAKNKKKL
jgi:hypothetical protein